MLSKLKVIEERFEEINNNLNDPTVIGNQDLFRELMKEYNVSSAEELAFKLK